MPLEITLEDAERSEFLELGIDVQGWKGEGLTRLNDGWLSVHGGLPGEYLRVHVYPRPHPKRRRADASILGILKASSDRRDASCDRFHTCHGCQLRMIDWSAENRLKETKIREIMTKFTGLDLNVTTIALPNFERHNGVRMRAGLSSLNGELGLKTLGKLVPMEECAALTTKAKLMVQRVVTSIRSEVHRVDIVAPENGPAIITIHSETVDDSLKRLASEEVGVQIVNDHQVLFQDGPKHAQVLAGKHLLSAEIGAWMPASEVASAPLYEWISELDLKGHLAVDLGCGIGGVSAQIAARFEHVVGIDSSLAAMRSYSENLSKFKFEALAGKFEKGLQLLAQRDARPDLITINPMREPIGTQTLSVIRHLAPQTILYLAPSPTSASKDLSELMEMWSISMISQANVHPNTHHTMLVCLLKRKPV